MSGDARVNAQMKTHPAPSKVVSSITCLACGPLTLNISEMTVARGDRIYKLTPKECHLLTAFMTHPGQVLPHALLLKEIWQTEYTGDMRMLHVHIRWLRTKIEEDPSHPTLLQTVRGRGYRFVPPDSLEGM
jgi:DNA-binding response OmpR family regulator